MLTKIDGLTIKVQIFCSHQLLQSQKKWDFKVDTQIDANKSLETYINASHFEEQKEALLKTASFSNARGIFIKCSYSLRSLIAKIKKRFCVSHDRDKCSFKLKQAPFFMALPCPNMNTKYIPCCFYS